MKRKEVVRMKKIVTGVLLGTLLFTGCASTDSSVSSVDSVVEMEKNVADEYDQLSKDNQFEYLAKEDLKTFIEHGTGILVLGFPQCPWCQAYYPMLDEVLKEYDVTAQYYNIYVDKTEDRTFYDEVATLLNEGNQTDAEILHYNNEGKAVIYMPLTVFIENGEIVGFEGESNDLDSNEIKPAEYWTDEKVDAIKDRLKPYVSHVKDLQDANNAKGCDSGCKYGG